jgi:hypothetical protein
MKSFLTLYIILGAALLLTHPGHSQVAGNPRSTREQLVALKAANEKLLEQQKAALLKLEDTQKEAAQLRIFVRRT